MKVLSLGLEVNADIDAKSEILMVQGSISGSEISGSASATSSPRAINRSCLNGLINIGGPIFTLKASSRLFIIKVNLAEAFLSVEPS